MKRDNKKTLYESIMTSVAREVKKVLNETKTVKNTKRKLNESVEKDPYDYLHDDYSRNQVRTLAREYIYDYYDEFPEEAEDENYLNWGEFENTGYEDLQEAWMYGNNWAAKIADEEFNKYAHEHGWSGY